MLKYQPIMARTEAGEQNNAGWAVNTALKARTWLEGYIRKPYPDEAQRISKRNKLLGLSAVFATLAIGASFVAPDALARTSDYLRDSGIIASTTPIKRTPFTFPQNLPTGDTNAVRSGDTFVDLSRPNQAVDAGRVVIINTAPSSLGFTARINRGVLTELATSTRLGVDIKQDLTAYILLVPFSLEPTGKTQINGFLQAEADMIDRSVELEKMNKISRFLYEGANFTINTEIKPVKSITPISLLDSLYFDAGRGIGSGLTSPKDLFAGVFSAGLLGGGGGPTDQEALGYQLSKKLVETIIIANGKAKSDPKNPPLDVTRFIENNPPIVVTKFNKPQFDKEWRKSKALLAPRISTISGTPDASYFIDPVDECFIGAIKQSSDTAPAVVNFSVGVQYKKPEPNKYITDQQIDYDGDGTWDTPFDSSVSGVQTRTYDKPGTHIFAARVRFNKGQQTKPCYGSIDLK